MSMACMHDLAESLSQDGCCVRAGDHCAQPVAQLWGNRATVRASMFMYNTSEEVATLVKAVRRAVSEWQQIL